MKGIEAANDRAHEYIRKQLSPHVHELQHSCEQNEHYFIFFFTVALFTLPSGQYFFYHSSIATDNYLIYFVNCRSVFGAEKSLRHRLTPIGFAGCSTEEGPSYDF